MIQRPTINSKSNFFLDSYLPFQASLRKTLWINSFHKKKPIDIKIIHFCGQNQSQPIFFLSLKFSHFFSPLSNEILINKKIKSKIKIEFNKLLGNESL